MMLARRHIPNALTLLRYALVPVFVASWYLPDLYGRYLPLVIMVVASLSDFFDGYLARKWQVQSELGRLLDPNADKLLIASALVMLCVYEDTSPVAVCLILCRELFVSGLRESMAERGVVVHVTRLAKWKTATQMVAIIVLLYAHSCGCVMTQQIGDALLWLSVALTIITGLDYIRKSLPAIRS